MYNYLLRHLSQILKKYRARELKLTTMLDISLDHEFSLEMWALKRQVTSFTIRYSGKESDMTEQQNNKNSWKPSSK